MLSFKNLFYPAFFSLFILSFFLIEGDYRFYLFSAWLIFVVLFGRLFGVNPAVATKSQLKAIVFSLLLTILFSMSVFFSTSLPLTIEKTMFYLVALVVFNFFILLPRQHFSIPKFLYYLSLTTLVLNIFVLFFTLLPPPTGFFPAMNMLVRIFGHNYYAAHVVLMLPLFWWQFLYSKQQEHLFDQKLMRFLSLLLLFSSYLLLFFSLARWSMLIGFLQLAVIFLINKAAFIELLHNQFAYAALKVFLLVLFVLLSIFLFLPLFFSNHEFCPLNFSYKEMCKPLLSNDRWQYWQKAVWVWQSSPWVGTGLKTFGFASRQFVLPNYNYSSYAHNIFLLNLAEGGVMIGVPFMIFVSYLLWKTWKISRSSKEVLPTFLFLAVSASLANALFDITWNFFVMFMLSLVLIALAWRFESSSGITLSQNLIRKITLCLNLQRWFLLAISLLLSLAFFSLTMLLEKNQVDLALRLFPFFDQPVRDLIFEKKLQQTQYERVYSLYRFDPDFVYNYTKLKEIDSAKKATLLAELSRLDPVLLTQNFTIIDMDPFSARMAIDAFLTASMKHHILNNTHFFDYYQQRNLAIDILYLANRAYQGGQFALAAHLYHQAKALDPHIFSTQTPVFITEKDLDKSAQFLPHFQIFNPESMRDFYDYMSLYQRTLLYLFSENRLDTFFQLTDAIVKFLPDHSWFIVNDLMLEAAAEEQDALFKVHERYVDWPAWQEVRYKPNSN